MKMRSPPKNGFLIHQFEWMVESKWKLLLTGDSVFVTVSSRVPGRTPHAAGSIISLGRWVCPRVLRGFLMGELGETLKARTGPSSTFLKDLLRFLIFRKRALSSFNLA